MSKLENNKSFYGNTIKDYMLQKYLFLPDYELNNDDFSNHIVEYIISESKTICFIIYNSSILIYIYDYTPYSDEKYLFKKEYYSETFYSKEKIYQTIDNYFDTFDIHKLFDQTDDDT